MTLIFSGNSFKYELEAICKLFFPVETFEFLFADDNPDNGIIPRGDYCFSTRITGQKSTMLSVFASVDGATASEYERICNDRQDYEDDCEFILSRLLFKCLSKLTGRHPEWGILTGVRPVKQINKLRAKGLGYEQLSAFLKTEYLVSEDKARIGYETAVNQDKIISAMPERSYSLYVSIPFCPTRCSYCSFVSSTVSGFKKLMPEYVDKLCEEIEYTANLVNGSNFTLDTVYFGGGTPTSLESDDLERIMKTILECFDLSRLREYTVEAGRPDTITIKKLKTIKRYGADRVSVNPQTIHDDVLEAIGRKHTAQQFYEGYSLARSVGFDAVNVDLIAGLPKDTFNGFKESLQSVLTLQPENITVHALSIKRASDLMKNYDTANPSEVAKMISYANNVLLDAGYKPYYLYRQKNQLDNQENIGWSRDGYEGVYNINIMEEIQSIIAVGAGATTKIVDGGFERFFNPKYPLDYIKGFDTVLERKSRAAKLMLSTKY